jgi:hypothetical protein
LYFLYELITQIKCPLIDIDISESLNRYIDFKRAIKLHIALGLLTDYQNTVDYGWEELASILLVPFELKHKELSDARSGCR